ncbi:MAG: hypothetical protein DRJ67_07630 [Thermoprotei archaeon]|mgnify:CR=1 FL=1|nr:MAG: hypothetical protein DRJ67_07630 [Thermoprotei archaeon]
MWLDHLRPKPKTRITVDWGQQVIDILEQLYGKALAPGREALMLSDLGSLPSDVIPALDAYYSLGSDARAWLRVVAQRGEFREDVTVAGRSVLKDGDPITVSDITDPALNKLWTMKMDLQGYLQRIYGKVAPLYVDEEGRVGVRIFELEEPAVNKLIYGVLRPAFPGYTVVALARNVGVPANATGVELIGETDVSAYKSKTITVKADYALTLKVYCYDDPSDYDSADPYHQATLDAGRAYTVRIEDEFMYVRLLVDNPDTADHVVYYAYVKGRGL